MRSAERSIVIAAPVEEVFAVVSDPRMNHLWSGMFDETELAGGGPLGVGTKFSSEARLLGRRITAEAVVTECEPNRRVCVHSTSGPIPLNGCRTVEAVEGGTKLTQTIEVEVGGFFGIADGIVMNVGLRQLETDLNTLKQLLESGALPPKN